MHQYKQATVFPSHSKLYGCLGRLVANARTASLCSAHTNKVISCPPYTTAMVRTSSLWLAATPSYTHTHTRSTNPTALCAEYCCRSFHSQAYHARTLPHSSHIVYWNHLCPCFFILSLSLCVLHYSTHAHIHAESRHISHTARLESSQVSHIVFAISHTTATRTVEGHQIQFDIQFFAEINFPKIFGPINFSRNVHRICRSFGQWKKFGIFLAKFSKKSHQYALINQYAINWCN